jgi:hypothetical protein
VTRTPLAGHSSSPPLPGAPRGAPGGLGREPACPV